MILLVSHLLLILIKITLNIILKLFIINLISGLKIIYLKMHFIILLILTI